MDEYNFYEGKPSEETHSDEILASKAVNDSESNSFNVQNKNKGNSRLSLFRSALSLSVVSLILACLGGIGIFVAVPAVIRSFLLGKETHSETILWAKLIAVISLLLNFVLFTISAIYFFSHYVPIVLPDGYDNSSFSMNIVSTLCISL